MYGWYKIWYPVQSHCLSKLCHFVQQMYLSLLLEVCQWCLWMKQARSESLGANEYWDLVKWSLVTLCSTGEGEPPLTPLAQCLALIQPHTPSPTSILVQCMKWELHQWAPLDWVDTVVGVGRKLLLTNVSVKHIKCMWYKLTVCWYLRRSLPLSLCMQKPFLWDLASLLNASHGDRCLAHVFA